MRVITVGERIERVRELIAAACRRGGRSPGAVTLIAVTKGFPPEVVREAVAAGVRDLGENRVQEAQAKIPALPDLPANVSWHMIGHLQTNKVKTVLNLFDTIHSVDSLRLAEEISRRALRQVPVFLEVNVSSEPTKQGFSLRDLPRRHEAIRGLPNVDVRGLMTVAPVVDRTEDARPVFRLLRQAAESLGVRELSMGMSDDFDVAIEEGSTHLRLGRAIFQERA